MELRITCEGSDLIDYKTIKNLQGSLKTRTMDDIEGMITSLILHGFSFPIFVWEHKGVIYAIDGHGRLLALSMMEQTGYWIDENGKLRDDGALWVIPPIPCVYIEARDLAEAKVKLLKLNSEYGTITQTGFEDFTKDLAVSEYTGIPLRITETDAIGELDPLLGNISEIIPVDIGEEEETGPPDIEEPETGFEPTLDPIIDISAVTHEDIEKATEKEHDKKELEVETMQITCKHCGKVLTVRKSDVNFLINQKIKELSNA